MNGGEATYRCYYCSREIEHPSPCIFCKELLKKVKPKNLIKLLNLEPNNIKKLEKFLEALKEE